MATTLSWRSTIITVLFTSLHSHEHTFEHVFVHSMAIGTVTSQQAPRCIGSGKCSSWTFTLRASPLRRPFSPSRYLIPAITYPPYHHISTPLIPRHTACTNRPGTHCPSLFARVCHALQLPERLSQPASMLHPPSPPPSPPTVKFVTPSITSFFT